MAKLPAVPGEVELRMADDILQGYRPSLLGHLQGIQAVAAGGYIAVTGSVDSDLFLLPAGREVTTDAGARPVRLQLDEQFHHAGGMQSIGDVLVIALERGSKRCGQGLVLFVDVSDPERPKLLPTRITRAGEADVPLQPSCSDRPMTLGTAAVGIARVRGGYLLVVGRWDSKILDFYESRGDDLHTAHFEYQDSWCASQLEVASDVPPGYAKYQNFSLVATPDQEIYLLGFANGLPGAPLNHADAFRVETCSGRHRLTKVAQKPFHCGVLGSKCEFRGAAGAHVDELGGLSVYSATFWASSPRKLRYARFGPGQVQ